MIIVNESKFSKINEGDTRVLENSFIYVLSHTIKLGEGPEDINGNDNMLSLVPSKELLDKLSSGEISKKQFKKEYVRSLKENDNMFLIYTIIRSLNENRYMPIFLCSDEEWEAGYLKILAKFISKRFGLEVTNVKKYRKDIVKMWKDAKRSSKKSKERKKNFRRSLKRHVRDLVQISLDGLENLEKLETRFAVDRIAVLINQSDDPMDSISKKSIIAAINKYSEYNKKAAKRVKRAIKDSGAHKKDRRWSKKDAIEIATNIYIDAHGISEK